MGMYVLCFGVVVSYCVWCVLCACWVVSVVVDNET